MHGKNEADKTNVATYIGCNDAEFRNFNRSRVFRIAGSRVYSVAARTGRRQFYERRHAAAGKSRFRFVYKESKTKACRDKSD